MNGKDATPLRPPQAQGREGEPLAVRAERSCQTRRERRRYQNGCNKEIRLSHRQRHGLQSTLSSGTRRLCDIATKRPRGSLHDNIFGKRTTTRSEKVSSKDEPGLTQKDRDDFIDISDFHDLQAAHSDALSIGDEKDVCAVVLDRLCLRAHAAYLPNRPVNFDSSCRQHVCANGLVLQGRYDRCCYRRSCRRAVNRDYRRAFVDEAHCNVTFVEGLVGVYLRYVRGRAYRRLGAALQVNVLDV